MGHLIIIIIVVVVIIIIVAINAIIITTVTVELINVRKTMWINKIVKRKIWETKS